VLKSLILQKPSSLLFYYILIPFKEQKANPGLRENDKKQRTSSQNSNCPNLQAAFTITRNVWNGVGTWKPYFCIKSNNLDDNFCLYKHVILQEDFQNIFNFNFLGQFKYNGMVVAR
jgi:hypothetical protein